MTLAASGHRRGSSGSSDAWPSVPAIRRPAGRLQLLRPAGRGPAVRRPAAACQSWPVHLAADQRLPTSVRRSTCASQPRSGPGAAGPLRAVPAAAVPGGERAASRPTSRGFHGWPCTSTSPDSTLPSGRRGGCHRAQPRSTPVRSSLTHDWVRPTARRAACRAGWWRSSLEQRGSDVELTGAGVDRACGDRPGRVRQQVLHLVGCQAGVGLQQQRDRAADDGSRLRGAAAAEQPAAGVAATQSLGVVGVDVGARVAQADDRRPGATRSTCRAWLPSC